MRVWIKLSSRTNQIKYRKEKYPMMRGIVSVNCMDWNFWKFPP